MSWNKLRLNYDKTLFLNFSKRKLNNSLKIYIDEFEIKEASQTKYLGVIFDNRLNWVPHTSNVVKKMAMGCWAIANLKNMLLQKHSELYTLPSFIPISTMVYPVGGLHPKNNCKKFM